MSTTGKNAKKTSQILKIIINGMHKFKKVYKDIH